MQLSFYRKEKTGEDALISQSAARIFDIEKPTWHNQENKKDSRYNWQCEKGERKEAKLGIIKRNKEK